MRSGSVITAPCSVFQYCFWICSERLFESWPEYRFQCLHISHSWFSPAEYWPICSMCQSSQHREEQILQTGSLCKKPAWTETKSWLMKPLRYSMNYLQFPNVRACHSRPLPLIKHTGKRPTLLLYFSPQCPPVWLWFGNNHFPTVNEAIVLWSLPWTVQLNKNASHFFFF